MATLYYESSFAHHGIKGQKWGVRRFQDTNGRLTAAGKARVKNGEQAAKLDSTGHRKLTTNWGKEAAKTAGITVAQLAAMTAIPPLADITILYHVGTNIHTKTADFVSKDGPYDDPRKLPKIKKESVDMSVKSTNEGKPTRGSGREVNCASCSVAMDLRQKGYDVRARRQNQGMTIPQISSMYKNASFKRVTPDKKNAQSVYNAVYDSIKKDNKGNSSGILTMEWKGLFSGAHAIYYQSKNGNVEFYDGQNGKSGSKIDNYFVEARPNSFQYMRTDDKKFNDQVVDCVISRKGGARR